MRLLQFSLFLLIIIVVHSCDPCKNLDCITSYYAFQFRIVDKVNGNDLVFGPNKIYDKNQIQFFSLNGADTIHYQYDPILFRDDHYDSVLYVTFYPVATSPVFMKLNNSDTDTLLVNYDSYDTKCCGRITNIANFNYNSNVTIPGDSGTQPIRK